MAYKMIDIFLDSVFRDYSTSASGKSKHLLPLYSTGL